MFHLVLLHVPQFVQLCDAPRARSSPGEGRRQQEGGTAQPVIWVQEGPLHTSCVPLRTCTTSLNLHFLTWKQIHRLPLGTHVRSRCVKESKGPGSWEVSPPATTPHTRRGCINMSTEAVDITALQHMVAGQAGSPQAVTAVCPESSPAQELSQRRCPPWSPWEV